MSSDRQTSRFGVPQFLPVTRAEGNIKNETNSRQVVFDYGLPTANLFVRPQRRMAQYARFRFLRRSKYQFQLSKISESAQKASPRNCGHCR